MQDHRIGRLTRIGGRLHGGIGQKVDYLEEVGSHPALPELRTLARAAALDEAGASLVTPFPEEMNVFSLPIPRRSHLGIPERVAAFVLGGR